LFSSIVRLIVFFSAVHRGEDPGDEAGVWPTRLAPKQEDEEERAHDVAEGRQGQETHGVGGQEGQHRQGDETKTEKEAEAMRPSDEAV
jgi:hypothetical protein